MGQSLFDALSHELASHGIPWSNVIGFASDSASVMVGRRNSVLSRVCEQQPDVFSLGCLCHLAALCATAGLKTLPLSIDNLLIDIFYHFKHSSKRWHEFLDDFEDIQPLRVLKHCTTRWLSLERAVRRLLKLWPALHAYFDREISSTGSNDRVRRIAAALSGIEAKLFASFVAFALRPLNRFNTAFQTTTSRIGSMQGDVLTLLRSYLANFVKPEILSLTDDITAVAFANHSNQLGNDELSIGTSTRLLHLQEEDNVAGSALETRFFSTVRRFYEETVRKMIAKFPFHDQVIADLGVLDPRKRKTMMPMSIARLCTRFHKQCTLDEQLDNITAEFLDYRSTPDDQLPSFDVNDDAAIEVFWHDMSKITGISDTSEQRFGHLAQLCKILTVLPHANADPERLFSMVNKVETEQHSSLHASTV